MSASLRDSSLHPIGEYIGHINLEDLPPEFRKRAEEGHRRFEEKYVHRKTDVKKEE